jgi:predicted nucleic acid-binding protein
MIVLLDASPLGLITNPGITLENEYAREGLSRLVHNGAEVVIPEIADYEVRRELVRSRKTHGLARLDALQQSIRYAPITTAIMRKAAENWAAARQSGRPSANNESLDADMILAAQAWELARLPGEEVVIATTNMRHLTRFARAQMWHEIN